MLGACVRMVLSFALWCCLRVFIGGKWWLLFCNFWWLGMSTLVWVGGDVLSVCSLLVGLVCCETCLRFGCRFIVLRMVLRLFVYLLWV